MLSKEFIALKPFPLRVFVAGTNEPPLENTIPK
jgi:hypothetical protein